MRHARRINKLSRPYAERKALLSNMAASLILHESIVTTEAKAKSVVPLVEKMITTAKKQTQASGRQLESVLPTEASVEKLLKVITPRFAERNGGYTTTVRMPKRQGDNTRMVKVSFVADNIKKAVKKD